MCFLWSSDKNLRFSWSSDKNLHFLEFSKLMHMNESVGTAASFSVEYESCEKYKKASNNELGN